MLKSGLIRLRQRSIEPLRFAFDSLHAAFGSTDLHRPTRTIHVALVSDGEAQTSEEQFHPFSAYRAELRNNLRLVSLRLALRDALLAPKLVLSPFDVVVVKLSFQTKRADAIRIVTEIRKAVGDRPVIYFDGDDDLCVQWPEILPSVDLYIKKHVFRDRNMYLRKFVGKSNLTDFVHHHFGHSFTDDEIAAESSAVPHEQQRKIVLGYNLASDKKILSLYNTRKSLCLQPDRINDVVFRGSVPNNWMRLLRKDIEPTLDRLGKSYRVILPKERVGHEEYYREMSQSKICISPFGYGEICWRDFEAILCGCLLIKPDMDHVETRPDVFQPHQTYVPVRWDFSDLDEQCSYYLEHQAERERIARAAFHVLDEFYRSSGVVKIISDIFGNWAASEEPS